MDEEMDREGYDTPVETFWSLENTVVPEVTDKLQPANQGK